MRSRYLMDVVLGLVLVAAPFEERAARDRPALYTDVGMGALLLAWALVWVWLKVDRMQNCLEADQIRILKSASQTAQPRTS